MFRKLTPNDLRTTFFNLLGEIECGAHFKADNPEHVHWLEQKITEFKARKFEFYGLYSADDQPIGLVSLWLDKRCGGYLTKAEIMQIGVLPELRGQGYGSKMLEFATVQAKSAGVYVLYIATYAGDYRTIAFYGKNGFPVVATLPDVHGSDDEGMVYMRKKMRPNDFVFI